MAWICVCVNVFVFGIIMLANHRIHEESGIAIIDGTMATGASLQSGISKRSVPIPASQLRATAAAVAANPNNQATTVTGSNKKYHFVFQTDCKDPTQDWQGNVLFYHMMKSRQPGNVTQVVTGCSHGGRKSLLQATHDTLITPMGKWTGAAESRFHLHFAPAHPQQEAIGGLRKFLKYFNRPYGIQHWMATTMGYSETQTSTPHDDTVIVIMDPDMIMLRPFPDELSTKDEKELWYMNLGNAMAQEIMQGHPMAQRRPYPTTWWKGVDPSNLPATVVEGIARLQQLDTIAVGQHYAAGPPFLAVARDAYSLLRIWNEATYPLYKALDEMIIREPHGPYNVAAAALQKPAHLAESFAVSDFRDDGLNLFKEILKPDRVAANEVPGCRDFPNEIKPHILQYSKRYAIGDKFIIGKHYVPMDLIGKNEGCQKPLFMEPPDDIGSQVNYYIDPEIKDTVKIDNAHLVHQMAFMVCETIHALNEAAIYYKRNLCQGNSNIEKTRVG